MSSTPATTEDQTQPEQEVAEDPGATPTPEAAPEAEPTDAEAEAEAVTDQPAAQTEAETEPEPVTEQPAAHTEAEPEAEQPAADTGPADQPADADTEQPEKPKKKRKKPKRKGPDPGELVKRIGASNEQAIAYVLKPDPQLTRMSRKAREQVIADLPPVTAGALLGPAALARHFIASAAHGRYRDLFALWELFSQRPEECKPVLAERRRALDRARAALRSSVRLGLRGHTERVVHDVAAARGLIWEWLREILVEDAVAVGARPAVVIAWRDRDAEADPPLPPEPSPRWLAEAAEVRQTRELPEDLDSLLSANVQRLPATIATLALAHEHYPEQVPAMIGRVDLEGPEIGSILAWARDHGMADRLASRVQELIDDAAAQDRQRGLSLWHAWQERGIDVRLPAALRTGSLDGLDIGRPETAELASQLLADGVDLPVQDLLDATAADNRQLAEKAYEAFVCTGIEVDLPAALDENPVVRDGTRCPHCRAWTWVRPGHEERCPRAPTATSKDAEPPAAEV